MLMDRANPFLILGVKMSDAVFESDRFEVRAQPNVDCFSCVFNVEFCIVQIWRLPIIDRGKHFERVCAEFMTTLALLGIVKAIRIFILCVCVSALTSLR